MMVESALVWFLRSLIRFYKWALSPILPPACRFHPTCSTYADESLKRHGLIRGFGYAFWRILRCNPFCEGGVDPVPESDRGVQ